MKVSYRKISSVLCIGLALGIFSGCGLESTLNKFTPSQKMEEKSDAKGSDVLSEEGSSETKEVSQKALEKYADIDLLTCRDLDPEYLRLASTNYYIWIDYGDNVSINALGQVKKAGDIQVNRIKDLVTGETIFYSVSYETFKKTEDYYYSSGSVSKLYDVTGKMLIDWDETSYSNGFNEWIISKKYVYSENGETTSENSRLINTYSGECIENVSWLDKVGDCFMASDNEGVYQYTIDRNGKKIFDFSEIRERVGDNTYINSYKDYIVAYNADEDDGNDDNSTIWFYTPQGIMLGFVQNVYNYYVYNDDVYESYVLIDNVIYNPSMGDGGALAPVYTNESTNYFDGDIAIRCLNDETISPRVDLVDAKTGEPLSEKFETINPEGTYETYGFDDIPSYFIGVTGDRIAKLDRNGSVVAEITIPGLYYAMPYVSGIRCAVDEWDTECLLDTDLKELIPAGKYSSIAAVYNDATETVSGVWLGTYFMDANQQFQRYEVITENGDVLIDGLSQVESLRNNNIGVVKGQFFGVMDLEGNWIYKVRKQDVTNMD